MVGSIAKRPTDRRKKNMGLAEKWRPLPKQRPVQERIKGRKHELKSPHILHATKDKHQLKRTSESNKHGDSKNGVKVKKKQIQMEWSMHKGLGHHLLVPNQYIGGGPRVKVFKGCGLAVGRKKESILGFPLKLLWEKCPTGMTFHPKEVSVG